MCCLIFKNCPDSFDPIQDLQYCWLLKCLFSVNFSSLFSSIVKFYQLLLSFWLWKDLKISVKWLVCCVSFIWRTIKIQNYVQAQLKTVTFYFSTFNIPIVTNHIRYRKPFASTWLRIVRNNTLSNKLFKWSQIWSSGEYKSMVLTAYKNHDGAI